MLGYSIDDLWDLMFTASCRWAQSTSSLPDTTTKGKIQKTCHSKLNYPLSTVTEKSCDLTSACAPASLFACGSLGTVSRSTPAPYSPWLGAADCFRCALPSSPRLPSAGHSAGKISVPKEPQKEIDSQQIQWIINIIYFQALHLILRPKTNASLNLKEVQLLVTQRAGGFGAGYRVFEHVVRWCSVV